MNWDKKGVLSMLAVVVFWTALPASACLLASHPTGQPACCRAMAKDCDSPVMGADNACCKVHGSNPAQVSVQPYSSVPSHRIADLPYQVGIESPSASGSGYSNTLETPPPKFPPGGAFALRI
jgi:hypothetical protein